MEKSALAVALLAVFMLSLVLPQSPGLSMSSRFLIPAASSQAVSDPTWSGNLQYGEAYSFPVNVKPGENLSISIVSNSAVEGQVLLDSPQAMIYNATGRLIRKVIGPLAGGSYSIFIANMMKGSTASVQLSYFLSPSLGGSLPAPIGIADYGVINTTQGEMAYPVKFKEVQGTAEILSLAAFNSAPPSGVSQYGASLQLNAVVVANSSLGQQVYWVQGVVDFVTNEDEYEYESSVSNFTSTSAGLSSSLITGSPTGSFIGNYYVYSTQYSHYSLPLSLGLVISATQVQGGFSVNFGYVQSGVASWYESVTISDPNANSVFFWVNPSAVTAGGHRYDAELVFGGEGNSEKTNFTSMDSSLNMSYVLLNGASAAPKALYGYGWDTAEEADDLRTVMSNGAPTVCLGEENFEQQVMPSNPSSTIYAIIFNESGLPRGYNWSVSMGGRTLSSTGQAMAFCEPAGTYSYSVAATSGYSSSPSSGSVTVSGTTTQPITFTQITYPVTFTESGLPSGTTWSVTLNGVTQSSTTSTITFNEPAGTYSYSVGSISGYTVSPSSGSVTVLGSGVLSVAFSRTVSLSESPLSVSSASPSQGQPVTISVKVTYPNGTPAEAQVVDFYVNGSLAGVSTSSSSGVATFSFTPSRAGTCNVTASLPSSPSTSSSSLVAISPSTSLPMTYVIILASVAVVLIALVSFRSTWRKNGKGPEEKKAH